MREARHTWLFEPGTWNAEGSFWERGELARRARGASVVRHEPDGWAIEGTIEVLGDSPLRFRNQYRLGAPAPDARVVPWQSENPAIGALAGCS